jgi:UDP-3-O-acyl N-acetylglucosamine deacetylase
VRLIGYRSQRTLAAAAEILGVGFVTGARVRVRLHPAPPDTGVLFCRTDLPNLTRTPAIVDYVTGTQRRTTLGTIEDGVTLVEHLLATLAGLRIDNCVVAINGPEPPGLDGSATGYVAAVLAAGVEVQPARRPVWSVSSPVIVSAGGATIGVHPADGTDLRISYLLDYGPFASISRQSHTLDVRADEFVAGISPCRTFVTEPEALALRSQGVGLHLTPADLLVFGNQGVIGNRLRFADEPARHKILDLIGDLALCGFDLAGHVVAYRSGHALNVDLARRLTSLAASSSVPASNLRLPPRHGLARAA